MPPSLRTLTFRIAERTHDGDPITRRDVSMSLHHFPWDVVITALMKARWVRTVVFELRWDGAGDHVEWGDELVELVLSSMQYVMSTCPRLYVSLSRC